VSLTCDAAYCFLLISIQNLWKVEDVQARKNLVRYNINPFMKRTVPLLATFLVTQQLGSLVAAPCFNFYKFGSDPLEELKQLISKAIDNYADDIPKQNILKQIKEQIGVCVPTELA
jgi:hypothetical protein